MPPRSQRPLYVDRLPPCNHACPAGENVQAWLAEAQAGNYRAAWELILRDNPLPAVEGRVCYHPCEDACNRGVMDGAVTVHAIERFIGDLALAEHWPVAPLAPPSGRRVLVVGAGPSGLSAAWHLARLGHAVTIYDSAPVAGGMMHFGIPKYRLPREVLDAEIARIVSLVVNIQLERRVTDLAREKADGRFDAVFVAVGAHLSRRQDIPAADASRIYDAIQFLKQVESGDRPRIGRKVAVYGGGNTAMDAARSARRLGAEPLIIYRRTRSEMPAHDFELEEALEEGVSVHWLRTIAGMSGSSLRVEVMRLDEHRRAVPTGEFETLAADSVVLALGQDTDTTFLRNVPGIQFNPDGSTRVAAEDDRMTRVGRRLRGALDELPQLLNVLRGEMSLVGPRPLVIDEDAMVVGLDRSRLHLTPGMTGPWQVLGTRVPMKEMVAIDYLYVSNWSLWLDVKLLVRTVGHVLRRGNV